uniref:Uncharacterized protein n=1 Tax=Schistocephalus solidus TaxID=70667 RepID=A0A0X3PLJ7_SCHSO
MQKDKSTLALIAAHIFVQLTVFWVHNAQFWTAHCEDKTQACNIHHLQRRLSDGYAEEFWSLQLRGMFAISLHTAWNQQFGQQDAVFSYKPLNHLQAVGKRLNAIPVITIAAYFSRAVFFASCATAVSISDWRTYVTQTQIQPSLVGAIYIILDLGFRKMP